MWSERLEFHPKKSLVVENSGGRLSSDSGLLIVREFDDKLGMTEQFAAMLNDKRRDPEHSPVSMVRQRIYGILAGYEDQNDHDTLRHPTETATNELLELIRAKSFCTCFDVRVSIVRLSALGVSTASH